MLDSSMSHAPQAGRERGSVLTRFRAASEILICLLGAPLLAANSGCLGSCYDTDSSPTFSPDGRRAVFLVFRNNTLLPFPDGEVISTDVALHHWTITNSDSWRRVWILRGEPSTDFQARVLFSPDSRYAAVLTSECLSCVDLETNKQTRLSFKGDQAESFAWIGRRELAYTTVDVDPEAARPRCGWPRSFWRIAIGDPPSKRALIHRDENCTSKVHYSWSPRGSYIVIRPTRRARWRCINVKDSRVFEFGATNLNTSYATHRPYESGVSWASDESRALCMSVYVNGAGAFILDPVTGNTRAFDKEAVALCGGAKSFRGRRVGLEAEWSPANEYFVLSHIGRLVNPDTWRSVDVQEELNRRFPSQGPFHSVIRKLSVPGWLLVVAENGRAYFTDFDLRELRALSDLGLRSVWYDWALHHDQPDGDVANWLVSPDGSRSVRRSMKGSEWEVFRLKSVLPPITRQDHP